MLDFGAKNHAHNSFGAFINFYPIKKKIYIAIREQIIFYSQGDIIKKFTQSNIIFTNVLYITTLVNKL